MSGGRRGVEATAEAIYWLRVSPGRQICLKPAAKLAFRPRSLDRVKSSFVERQNGCKPPWTSDSHATGSRIVCRFQCIAATCYDLIAVKLPI
jgi:hypothetical protein